MEYFFDVLAGFAVIFLAIYYYLTSNFDFWRRRGVAGPEPSLIFGNIKDVMLNKVFVGDYVMELYQKYKDEAMFGIFFGRTPILIVKDPEQIKNVLVKDFSTFADRGFTVFEKIEPLSQHLFSLEPERWRPLRVNLSPIFTSGKLKEMFHLLMECAQHFEQFLDTVTTKNPEIECRDLTAKFTTDVIGVCVFGLKMNALAEEESMFRTIGRKTFEINKLKSLKLKIRSSAPWLYKLLGPLMYDHERNDFFIGIMKETMAYRKKNNIKKHDMVDLLMEIRDNPNKIANFEMTDEIISAQAFVFFIAGFETTSTTISNALYELALNQLIQQKLREEIMQEFQNNNGTLTFESIKNMKYMHKVFNETLRKYPPVVTHLRMSTKEYTFPGTQVTIPKGIKVWIPAYAIHRDPEIYTDPETFDPERFDEENVKQRHPSHYLPFGDGPRNCIGSRFANYQSKVGLAVVIQNFQIDICDKTCIPYINNPRAPLLLSPKGGITLKFTKLKQ